MRTNTTTDNERIRAAAFVIDITQVVLTVLELFNFARIKRCKYLHRRKLT